MKVVCNHVNINRELDILEERAVELFDAHLRMIKNHTPESEQAHSSAWLQLYYACGKDMTIFDANCRWVDCFHQYIK